MKNENNRLILSLSLRNIVGFAHAADWEQNRALQRGEQCGRPLGRSSDEGPRQSQVHRERDEVLLGAVVDVALQPPPLLVLGRNDPFPRGLQIPRPLGAFP